MVTINRDREFRIGDHVSIVENDRLLDCCSGKRGRIRFVGVGGGWLLVTDHFCPVERDDAELTWISPRRRAEEYLAGKKPDIVAQYVEIADRDPGRILKHVRNDELAWAVAVREGLISVEEEGVVGTT